MMKILAIPCLFLAACLSLAAGDSEYPPSAETYLLMHFNKDLSMIGQNETASAELFGGAKLAGDGWKDGCLDVSGGGVSVQTSRPFISQYGHIALEARVFLKEYPKGKERAYIIDKVFQCKNPVVNNVKPEDGAVGVSMFIDNNGRIGNEISSLYYGPGRIVTFWSPHEFKFPLYKWVHVAVVNAGWPVGKYKIYVDGNPVLVSNHEFSHRIFYSNEKETANGKIIIGNNSRHTGAFPGLIDEVRIFGSNLDLQPLADISWTDPKSLRPLIRSYPSFLKGTVPYAYVSLDKPDSMDTPEPGRFKAMVKDGQYLPGVRGNALSGGTLTLKGMDIISGKEGSVEFWMMPENWNNKMARNLTFMNFGGFPRVRMHLFNSAHELRNMTLFFSNDENQSSFIGFGDFIKEKDWYHIVVTWKGNRYRIYLNGYLVAEQALTKCENLIKSSRDEISFTGINGDWKTRLDEIYVYGRQLAPDEVWNSFARYRDPAKLKEATPYLVTFKNYPSCDKVSAEVDLLEGRRPVKASMSLLQKNSAISSETIDLPLNIPIVFSINVSSEKIEPGEFQACLKFLDENGKVFQKVTRPQVKKVYPWLHNKLGVPAAVPEPWIPLALEGTKVKCLLSEYDFSKGLIRQIVTDKEKTLSSPVAFEALLPGGAVILNQSGDAKIELLENGLGAKICQKFKGDGIEIESIGEMEFDGFIKYSFNLHAEKDNVSINGLRLRIPLSSTQALDYYVLGEHMDHLADTVPLQDGSFFSSLETKLRKRHELAEYGAMKRASRESGDGSFLPFAWAGNTHRGLCFMANDDRGWIRSDSRPAIQFTKDKNQVFIDLNLISDPATLTKDGKREIVISLMATPSKRPPKGWRHWTTSSFFVASAAGRVLDADLFYVPYPVDYDKSAEYMKGVWKQGSTPLPYCDFYGSDTRMENAEDFRWEWWPQNISEVFQKRSGVYRANYCSGSLTDWYLFNFNQWVERSGVNGLYIDNIYPAPMYSPLAGPGYVDEQGQTRSGYQLFAMREYVKRIYCLMSSKGKPHPYTMLHMTHCMIGPVLSFADIAYEGEDYYINGLNDKAAGDAITLWSNNIVRIIDSPHAWGIGIHWLGHVTGGEQTWKLPPSRDYYIRAWYTQLMLHDEIGGIDKDKGARAAFDSFLKRDPETKFVLYRDNKAILATPADGIYISYYVRPGKILAVIGNQGQEERNLKIAVDLKSLGLSDAKFLDGETKNVIAGDAESLNISVPKHDYRLLLIKINDEAINNEDISKPKIKKGDRK